MSTPLTFEQLVAAEHEVGADSATPCEDYDDALNECEWRARMLAPLLGIEVPPLPWRGIAIEAADGSVVLP